MQKNSIEKKLFNNFFKHQNYILHQNYLFNNYLIIKILFNNYSIKKKLLNNYLIIRKKYQKILKNFKKNSKKTKNYYLLFLIINSLQSELFEIFLFDTVEFGLYGILIG